VKKPDRRRRADEALALVQLGGYGGRKPVQLSGGQRQRVALARAIVNHPRVLLLDEPLGALDLKLRQEMQIELKRIQQEVGITFVYVTHDQEEALTMSDRIAVFSQGRVEQVGTPVEVYEHPSSEFVAGFVGVSNLLDRGGRRFTVRPEKIRIVAAGEQAPSGYEAEPGVLSAVVYVGAGSRAKADQPPEKIGKGEGALNVIEWPAYTDKSFATPFEKATGCKIHRRDAGSSNQMVALMRAGGGGGGGQWDLVSASGDASLRLVYGKDVVPINVNLLPSWKQFFPYFKSPAHNTVKGVHYGISLQWGPNTLIYNTKQVKPAPTSWGAVYGKKYSGKMSIPNNPIQI